MLNQQSTLLMDKITKQEYVTNESTPSHSCKNPYSESLKLKFVLTKI